MTNKSYFIDPDIKIYIIGDPYTYEGQRAIDLTKNSFYASGFTNCIVQEYAWISKLDQGGYDYQIPLFKMLGKQKISEWFSYVNILRKIRRLEDDAVIITQQGAKLHRNFLDDPFVYGSLDFIDDKIFMDTRYFKFWPLAKGSVTNKALFSFGTFITPKMAWSLVNQICKSNLYKNSPIGIDIPLDEFLGKSWKRWIAEENHGDFLNTVKFGSEMNMARYAFPINVHGM